MNGESAMTGIAAAISSDNIWSVLWLFFLAVLIPVAAYFVTRYFAKKAQGTQHTPAMKQLARMFLGRDKYILLLKIGEKGYILGVTNQSISRIGTLSEQEMEAYDAGDAARDAGGGFVQKLKNFINAPKTLRREREAYRQFGGRPFGDIYQDELQDEANPDPDAGPQDGDGT